MVQDRLAQMGERWLWKFSNFYVQMERRSTRARIFSNSINNSQKCLTLNLRNMQRSQNLPSGKNEEKVVVKSSSIWAKGKCSPNKLVLPFTEYFSTQFYKPKFCNLQERVRAYKFNLRYNIGVDCKIGQDNKVPW